MVVGVQVFAIAIELPQKYMKPTSEVSQCFLDLSWLLDGLRTDHIPHPADQIHHSIDHRRLLDANRSGLGGQRPTFRRECRNGSSNCCKLNQTVMTEFPFPSCTLAYSLSPSLQPGWASKTGSWMSYSGNALLELLSAS